MAEVNNSIALVITFSKSHFSLYQSQLVGCISIQTTFPDEIVTYLDFEAGKEVLLEMNRILSRYAPKTKVVGGEHVGRAEALNIAVEEIESSYISFWDADDIYSPNFVEKMKSSLEDNLEIRPDLVAANMKLMSGKLHPGQSSEHSSSLDRPLLSRKSPIAFPAIVVRREAMIHKFRRIRAAVDFVWLVDNKESIKNMFFISDVLASYKPDKSSISRSKLASQAAYSLCRLKYPIFFENAYPRSGNPSIGFRVLKSPLEVAVRLADLFLSIRR